MTSTGRALFKTGKRNPIKYRCDKRDSAWPVLRCEFELGEERSACCLYVSLRVFDGAIDQWRVRHSEFVSDFVILCEVPHILIFEVGALIAHPKFHSGECADPAGQFAGSCVTVCSNVGCEPYVGGKVVFDNEDVLYIVLTRFKVQEIRMDDFAWGSCMECNEERARDFVA